MKLPFRFLLLLSLFLFIATGAGFAAPTITATKDDGVATGVRKVSGSTIDYTNTINNTAAPGAGNDATGVTFTDPDVAHTLLVGGTVKVTPIAFDDTYNAVGNTLLTVNAANGLLANDIDPDNLPHAGTNVKVASVTHTGANLTGGGASTLNVAADGSFTYLPGVGGTGTETFTYLVTDSNALDSVTTGTITFTVTGRVWYVVNGGSGDGRSTTPLGSPATASTNANQATDVIYVYQNAVALNGPFTLANGVKLVGEGVPFSVNSIALPRPVGTAPTLTNTGGNTVTLNSAGAAAANTITGVTLGNRASGSSAITGTSFGTLTVTSDVVVNGTGAIMNLNTGTLAATFSSLSTTSATTNAITLNGVGGTLGVTGTTAISGITGAGVVVNGSVAITFATLNLSGISSAGVSLGTHNGPFTVTSGTFSTITGNDVVALLGTGNISIGATITNTAGNSVNISGKTGGIVTFSSAISDTGTGISLVNNTGATINFTGGLNLSTGANPAFIATGGGTVTTTQNNTSIVNTLTTTSGVALNVANTTIGASGLTFRSISANGAANGIVLNTTGASGGLTVTGNSNGNGGGVVTVNPVGTAATVTAPDIADLTGGTIQNTTGVGISLNSTMNVSLTRMRVLNSGTDGINVSNINGFTLSRCFISDSSGVAGDKGIEMGDFSTGTAVSGTINITNSTVGPTPHDNFGVGIGSGTSTWNMTGSVFTGSVLNSGFNFEIRNATVSSFLMDGCVCQNQFADGMQMQPASGVNATVTTATIQNSTFQSNNIGIDLNHDGTSNVTYKVLTNTFLNQVANSINFFSSAVQAPTTGGTLNGRFDGNVIGNAAVFNSGGGIGIRVNINGGAHSNVLLNNNTIRQIPNGRGIEIISRNGTGGLDATVTNNFVNTDFVATVANGGFSLSNIFLQSNALAVANTLRADVRGNTVPAVAPTGELVAGQIVLIRSSTSTFNFVDTTAPISGTAASELAATNTGSTATTGTITLIAGPISTPPLLFAQGGVESIRESVTSVASVTENVVSPNDASPSPNVLNTIPEAVAEASASSAKLLPLTQSQLDSLITVARERWTATGLTEIQLDTLRAVKFEVADLPGWYLGEAGGTTIRVDNNAGGNGWYVDASPESDALFGSITSPTRRYTDPAGAAAGRIDLLTTVLHEMGHALGLNDSYLEQDRDSIMFGQLTKGERRFPAQGQAAGAVPQTDGVSHFLGSPISIGTLPAGKSVKIFYSVQVENPITPNTTTQTSSQATVSGSNFTTVNGGTSTLVSNTDDPTVGGTNDPTVTLLAPPPTVTANTANRAINAPTLVINGTNFSTVLADNAVVFNLGAVGSVTGATATQLTVTFSTPPSLGALNATVTTSWSGASAGSSPATQVATIVPAPTVTASTASRAINAPTLVIAGTGFDAVTPANNLVTFSNGAIGNVTAATATSLTVTFTTQPVATGSLTAIVTSFGGQSGTPSGTPVQVATIVAAPTVTANTANVAITAPTITIAGTGFDAGTPANNAVVFNNGATGNVTAATGTSLTVSFTALPAATGSLTAIVSSNGGSSGAAVQVATIVAAPTVTLNTANLAINAPTITISGTGFDAGTPANNTVTFNNGATGNVTAATSTQLTVTFTAQPAATGSLTAIVTSFGGSSGAAVQVANIVAAPTVTLNVANRAINAPTIMIAGTGFDAGTPANNSVVFNNGATGNVTAATATSLTVTFTAQPAATGSLTAIVTSFGGTSGPAVQVATIVAAPTVTLNTANVGQNAPTITIGGTGFNAATPGANLVTFNLGASGNVTAATATSLTVTFTVQPTTTGSLTAVVNSNGGSSGAAVQVATIIPLSITPNTANLAQNATQLIINGSGFSTTPANNTVVLSSGTATVTASTATQLTCTLGGPPSLGALNATVTVSGSGSAGPTQVATIVAAPTVTANTASLPINAATVTLAGTGFNGTTPGANTVVFNNGAVGNVTAASATSLTVTFTTAPAAAGSLTAVVTSFGGSSGAAVQVATVVPAITVNSANLAANATSLVINGFGFSATPANNTVVLTGGTAGTVTAASTTQLTVTVSNLTAGSLTGTVTVNSATSAGAQVATVTPVVTANTANVATNASSMVINGFGFDPTPANNVVTFSGAITGTRTVTAATATSLTVTLSGQVVGNLNAVVVSNSQSSGAPVQVATVVELGITPNTANLAQNAPQLIISGAGFSATPANNTVVLSSGTATVTASTTTQLTCTLAGPPSLGVLNATVTVTGTGSTGPTQVATIVAPPTVTLNTANLAQNAPQLIIAGTGFNATTPANNTVVLSSGTATVTAATATQLTVTFSVQPSLGSLTAVVTSHGGSSGPAVQVATIVAPPTVTLNTANLAQNAPQLIITGTGFNATTPANNTVVLSSGTGTVTAATATQLTCTLAGPPSLGSLTAIVTSNGGSSGASVQVATIVAAPTVTANTANLARNAPQLIIAGTGFNATTPANNTVVLSSGIGAVTNATATQLTVTFSVQPSLGNLTAIVTSNGGSSGAAVQVATVTPSADLSINKTDGVSSVSAGGSTTYTITASNAGPDDVTGAPLADTFPASLTATWTATGAGGATVPAASGSGNINALVNLPAGGSVTYTVSCTISAAATGTLANTATIAVPAGVTDLDSGNNSATDTDSITQNADLAITKTDGATTEVPGTTVTYTIVASNSGPSTATGATVADTFPASLSSVTWTAVFAGGASGTAAGNGNINELVTLPSGGSATYSVTGNISPTATGSLSNTATISAPGGVTDAIPGNNSATDTDTLTPQADLAITKTDGATTEVPGTAVTYTIVAGNSGPSTATGATVADTLPASLSSVTWTAAFAGGASGTAAGSGNINELVTLPSGGTATYSVTGNINPTATGSLSNTATISAPGGVTDAIPGNNSATDTDTLTPQADLAITKTDGSATEVPGTSVTYTIVAGNSGPSTATGATVADTFPASLSSVTWTAVFAGGASGTAAGSGNINELVTLPSGATATYSVTGNINPTATGSLSNTATITAPAGVTDPNSANNSATDTDTLTPQADLAITKTDGVTTANAGGSVTYTITASNAGPSNAVGATVADTLPASLTGVTWTAVGAGGGTVTASGSGDINDTVGLPVGGSVTYTVSATLSPGASGTLSNTATVTAPGGVTDPDPANNSATDSDTIVQNADLAIDLAAPPSAPKNTNVAFTITLANNGPAAAANSSVSFPIPAQMTFVSVTTPAGWNGVTPAPGLGGTVTFSKSSFASGDPATVFTVVLKVAPATATGTVITATATASSSNPDPNSANNSDTVQIAVGTVDPTPAQVGTTGTLNRNNGLFELTVDVTNTTPNAINGFKLHVNFAAYLAAYPSLRLYNASSAPGASDVFVNYPYPVPVDGVIPVKLSFYTSTRTFPDPFAPILTVEALATSAVSDSNGAGVQPRIVMLPNGNVMLEWDSVPGHWYRVRYSSNDMTHWFDSPVPIQAANNRMQWIDSGAPFTSSPPSSVSSRYYRVNEIAAPTP